MLQTGRLMKSCSWSKASWLGKLAPSVERKKKIGLEQERKKEICSKSKEIIEKRRGATIEKIRIYSKSKEIIEKLVGANKNKY